MNLEVTGLDEWPCPTSLPTPHLQPQPLPTRLSLRLAAKSPRRAAPGSAVRPTTGAASRPQLHPQHCPRVLSSPVKTLLGVSDSSAFHFCVQSQPPPLISEFTRVFGPRSLHFTSLVPGWLQGLISRLRGLERPPAPLVSFSHAPQC